MTHPPVPSRLPLRAVLACCGLALAGCAERVNAPNDPASPLSVAAERVTLRPLPLNMEAVGRTEGSRQIELRARVSGILAKQTYTEGAMVNAGEVLFHIDPAPFEIALALAQAALAQERATQAQAARNAKRLTALVQQQAVSERQADDAVSALDAANAAVLAAEARVREAQINLSYTQVEAPIGGVAGRAEQSEGSLVTAGAQSSLLTTVAQTDPIWVRFALSVEEHAALRGALADATALSVELLDAQGRATGARGRINFAGSTVDPLLGTVQLRAQIANPTLALLPGEYVRVRLSGGEAQGVAVPQTAVLESASGPYVWVVDESGKARQRAVRTGAWIGEAMRILSGLTDGDVVILDNLLKLSAGRAVNIDGAPTVARTDALKNFHDR